MPVTITNLESRRGPKGALTAAAFLCSNMFETGDFTQQLQNAIANEAGLGSMTEYQSGIVSYLQTLAQQNEATLMLSENVKTAAARRGVPDALTSARSIIRAAAATAKAANRTLLTQGDVEAAYRAQFCRVWPFCR